MQPYKILYKGMLILWVREAKGSSTFRNLRRILRTLLVTLVILVVSGPQTNAWHRATGYTEVLSPTLTVVSTKAVYLCKVPLTDAK